MESITKQKDKKIGKVVVVKVLSFTLLICSCSIIRSILIVADMHYDLSNYPAFDAIYYSFFEAVPLLLMLVILYWKPAGRKKSLQINQNTLVATHQETERLVSEVDWNQEDEEALNS